MMQVGYTRLRLVFSCFALLAGTGKFKRPTRAGMEPPHSGPGQLVAAVLQCLGFFWGCRCFLLISSFMFF